MMLKRLFGAMAIVSALALPVITAQATPIPITVQLQTDTTAVAEGNADTHSDTSPPTSAPLTTSSVVVGVTDFAAGGAIAADGVLNTSADASSASGFASAVGSARYLASFDGARAAVLHLDFLSSDFTDPSSSSLATLILRIANDGITVFEDVITLSGVYDYTVAFARGVNQSIDLLLTSEAFTLTGGNAFNGANLSFGVTLIPEPGSLALVLVALLAAGAQRYRTRPMSAEAVPA